MPTTYTKAKHLSLGYDQREERLILTVHLQDGNNCKVLIIRRLLSMLLEKLTHVYGGGDKTVR